MSVDRAVIDFIGECLYYILELMPVPNSKRWGIPIAIGVIAIIIAFVAFALFMQTRFHRLPAEDHYWPLLRGLSVEEGTDPAFAAADALRLR
jgi:hypothetical protein